MSNFTYCSLVWHFCGTTNNSKIVKIQERALRIVYNDYDSDIVDLLKEFGTDTVLQSRLKTMILEVFKAEKNISPVYIREIFREKHQPYFLRNPHPLIQTKKDTTNFGLRTFGYLGSKLWNELDPSLKNLSEEDIPLFKSLLKKNGNVLTPRSIQTLYCDLMALCDVPK